jgi:hypothetical protein
MQNLRMQLPLPQPPALQPELALVHRAVLLVVFQGASPAGL